LIHPNYECENCGRTHTSFTLQNNNQNKILKEKWCMIKIVMMIPLFIFGLFFCMILFFRYDFTNQCLEQFTNIQLEQCLKLINNVWDQPANTILIDIGFCIIVLFSLRITIFRGVK
jgi:uncharacterized membrane protein YvbJ